MKYEQDPFKWWLWCVISYVISYHIIKTTEATKEKMYYMEHHIIELYRIKMFKMENQGCTTIIIVLSSVWRSHMRLHNVSYVTFLYC